MANINFRSPKSSTPVVMNLIIINAIVFVAQLVFDKTNLQGNWLTSRLALYSIDTMGMLGAYAFTYPNVQFFIIPFPFPIKAKYLAMGYAAIDLFGGVAGGGDGIAHFAHLGGLVMGIILALLWTKKNQNFRF